MGDSERTPDELELSDDDVTRILEGANRAELEDRSGEEMNFDFWVACVISATKLIVVERLRATSKAEEAADFWKVFDARFYVSPERWERIGRELGSPDFVHDRNVILVRCGDDEPLRPTRREEDAE